ncbi:hypothetical protein JTL86_08350 [Pseudomonas aeruginosa]|nr:hypothetical protein [Pseudomonas aeruginosa]
MTTQETTTQTTETTATPVIFFGKDFTTIEGKTTKTNANVLKETLGQFALKVNNTKMEDKIKVEGDTIEEIQAKLAELLQQKQNAARTADQITLATATIPDLLKHKSEELGSFLFELLEEVAVQLKSTGSTGTKTTRANYTAPAKTLYAFKVEGVNEGKPFFSMNTGALSKQLVELTEKIEAAGLTADYQEKVIAGPKKDQMGWSKKKLFEGFAVKVDLTNEELISKFDGKIGGVTVEALGDKMPKLETKKVGKKK